MSNNNQVKPQDQPSLWSRFKAAWSHDWQATLNAPRPFLVCSGAAIVVLYAIFQFTYSARIANLEAAITEKDSTIQNLGTSLSASEKEASRLRVAAKIDPADTRTAYSILTNEELASRTMNAVKQMRDLYQWASKRLENFDRENPKDPKATNEESGKRFQKRLVIASEESEKIDREIGSESINLLYELQRRIPEQNRRHILGGGIKLKDYDPFGKGPEVRLLFGMPMGISLSVLPTFANELEALSKLLPPDPQPSK